MTKRTEKFEVTGRSSKAEILEAYENLRAKVEEFSSKGPADKKVEELIRTEERKIVERASSFTVENVVKGLADLHVQIGKAFTELSGQMMREAGKLEDLQTAIEVETRHLEEVRDIRVAADALALLMEEYRAKERLLETEMAEKEKRLASQIREKREEWEREQAEYAYNLSLSRKKEHDEYEQRKAALERELKEGRSVQEKEFSEREAALLAREGELNELRTKVEGFRATLEQAVREAEERTATAVQERAAMAAKLSAKEVEGERKVLELKIGSLQSLVDRQAAEVQTLTKQLAEANGQVQAIAVKAIEGASGARTLSTVQEIALEQAKQAKLQK